VVLDPFVGGGTTLVESLALGSHGVGIDISALATFVSEVKTTLLTDKELDLLARISHSEVPHPPRTVTVRAIR
jgi:tRNA G10  N-methylase Trm11